MWLPLIYVQCFHSTSHHEWGHWWRRMMAIKWQIQLSIIMCHAAMKYKKIKAIIFNIAELQVKLLLFSMKWASNKQCNTLNIIWWYAGVNYFVIKYFCLLYVYITTSLASWKVRNKWRHFRWSFKNTLKQTIAYPYIRGVHCKHVGMKITPVLYLQHSMQALSMWKLSGKVD